MESKEIIINIDRSKLSRKEQYTPKEKAPQPKQAHRGGRRRRRNDKSVFWKVVSGVVAVLLLFSLHLNNKAIGLITDLQNDLLESIASLAEMQDAYKELGAMYTLKCQECQELEEQKALQTEQEDPPSNPEVMLVEEGNTTEAVPEPTALIAYPEQFNEIPLSEDLIAYIYEQSTAAGINPDIFFAIAWKESNYTPYNLVSSTNDYGMFQINQCNFGTIADHFGISKSQVGDKLLSDPYFCTDCSIFILTSIISSYGPDDYHQLLMIYNMGPGNAAKCFQKGYTSSEYSRKVVTYAMNTFNLTDTSL